MRLLVHTALICATTLGSIAIADAMPAARAPAPVFGATGAQIEKAVVIVNRRVVVRRPRVIVRRPRRVVRRVIIR